MNIPNEKLKQVFEALQKIKTICEESPDVPADLGVIEMLANDALRKFEDVTP